jgi:outer membrane protein OmpA-like peptidoglycan-associated protein
MIGRNSLIFVSLVSVLVSGQVYAAWGDKDVDNNIVKPKVVSSGLAPAQKQGLLRQKGQLLTKQKKYQALINQVNASMTRRPDLKATLLVQLTNYQRQMSVVGNQLTQVNQRLSVGGGAQHSMVKADDDAVTALFTFFDIPTKALVHDPRLLKAKSKKERKVVIRDIVSEQGYRVSTDVDSDTLFDDQMVFQNGSARLLPAAAKRVANLAAFYKRSGGHVTRVIVKGHTNSVGGTAGNLKLSRDRSNAVKTALMKLQVPASVIVTQGFGESKLLPNIDPRSPLNRRVEYGVIKK